MKQVTIYSTPTCRGCYELKQTLAESKVKFAIVDILEDTEAGRALVAKTGMMMVPQTQIIDMETGAEDFVFGNNPKMVLELITNKVLDITTKV